MLRVELIQRKKAFKVALNATVSFASTDITRNDPSLSSFTNARWAGGELASGPKAFRRVVSCFSVPNFKRIEALAHDDIERSHLITDY
jgi:hypothetical protein